MSVANYFNVMTDQIVSSELNLEIWMTVKMDKSISGIMENLRIQNGKQSKEPFERYLRAEYLCYFWKNLLISGGYELFYLVNLVWIQHRENPKWLHTRWEVRSDPPCLIIRALSKEYYINGTVNQEK